MSQQSSQNKAPVLGNTVPNVPKAQNPREQEFSMIVKELKNGTVAGFVRRINVGGRWADNPAEVTLKTEVGNALAAMRKNCGSDEQFARLIQEMVDILVNADKETLQIRTDAQKKLSELKEQCAREGSGRGQRSEVPEKRSDSPEKIGVLKAAYLKSKEAVFNAVPPELRLPSKEEFERINTLSPADLSKYETALLGDEKKLKKFLHAWQVGGLDKSWKDYVTVAHPESAKRLDSLYAKAVKQLGNANIDSSFSNRFNESRDLVSKTAEIGAISAAISRDASWMESTFKKGGLSVAGGLALAQYGTEGETRKASIVATLPALEALEKKLLTFSIPNEEALNRVRVLKHAAALIQRLEVKGKPTDRYFKNEGSLLASATQSIQKNAIHTVSVEMASKTTQIESHSPENGITVTDSVEKTLSMKSRSLADQKKEYREKGIQNINPEDFANFLSGLNAEGNLSLSGLSQILSEKTAKELIFRWQVETPAQKILANNKDISTLNKTKKIFSEYEVVLAERLKANPDIARKTLAQAGISKENIDRALLFAQSPNGSVDGMIKSLGLVGNKSDRFVIDFLEGLWSDKGFEASKKIKEWSLSRFNSSSKISNFVSELDQWVIASKVQRPEDRIYIANLGALTFIDLQKDPSAQKRVLSILESIQQWRGMNAEQSRAFREIQSLLTAVSAQNSYKAVARDKNLRKSVTDKAKIVSDDAARSKTPFTDEQFAASTKKAIGNSKLAEQVEQAGASIAIKESAKAELAPQKGEKSPQDILAEMGLSQYTWEQIMADSALRMLFRKAYAEVKDPSEKLNKMSQIITDLVSRDLERQYAAGTLDDFHTNNARRLQAEYGRNYFAPTGASSSNSDDPRAAFRNIERGSWNTDAYWEAGIASTANISYASLSSQAIPFNSSGNIYNALSASDAPLNLGNCIIAQDTSGRVTVATPNERFTVEAKEAPAILALTRISGQLNMPFLISSIPLLRPLLKRDDATRDGFSAREESELTARVAAMLGFSDLSPTDSSAQIIRHMENQRDPRYSYEWLAQKNGLIGNNGRPIESTLVAAFKNAGSITAANAKNQVGEIPNFQTA
jgi:hypothetical protein